MLSKYLENGVKLELHQEVMPDDDEYTSDSIFSFRLLPSLASPLIASNYGVGTNNLEIFDRIAAKLPLGVDYVYYRDSQYEYCLVYGDLSYSGSSFAGSNCTKITYYTYSGSGGQPSFSSQNVSNFSLSVGNYLVYSNLGNYPMLGGDQGGYRYQVLTQVFLLIFTLLYVLWGFARYRLR